MSASRFARGLQGQGGVTVKKTNSALVFGIYDEPVSPGECNIVVERLGDYLVEQGIWSCIIYLLSWPSHYWGL